MSIINLLVGTLLVFFGRTLYWAFVAIAGFLVGLELAAVFLADQTELVRLFAALLGGVLGALLGVIAQRIAFSIGGLFAGGYLGLVLARSADIPGEPLVWFVVGGILGAIIAAMVMDWAIIGLSSLVGAAAIVDQFALDASLATFLVIAITAIGIVVQGRRLRTRDRESLI
jgi:hypothetical protein